MPVEIGEINVNVGTDTPFISLSGEGTDDLFCIGARVRERLSTPTETRIEFTSRVTTFDPKAILGKRFVVETLQGFKVSGIVISVEDIGIRMGTDVYAAELRPWLWLAGQVEDNRIFQQMKTVEIVQKVLSDMGMTEVEANIKASHDIRDYCVQYGETNFAFVSRLIEEEGIYYYFDYSGEVERLVLTDDPGIHPDKGTIPFTQSNVLEQVRAEADTIYEWAEVKQIVSGKVSLWDYDFELPNANLLATKAATGIGDHSYNTLERYRSDAHYKVVERGETFFAAHVAEAHAADYARATGLCNTELVRTGSVFTLEYPDHTAFEGRYLVVASTHYMRFDDNQRGTELQRLNRQAERIVYPDQMALYEASFEVQPAATPFRPHRMTPWPEVPSLLTALVTGPAGEEIHTDEYGRIKVQFPWDRVGGKDDNSSCWVRTVMPWTGKDWGFIAVPRIGMEVIIQFERGNIDRPICTGMVYNGVNTAPYGMPGGMNKSGVRTNSTKGGGGFHELTFDDTKGSESIFLQSEKDYKEVIKNNAVVTIGMEKKDKGDLTQTIYRHRTETLKTGDNTFTVEAGSETISIAKDQSITIGNNQTEDVGKDVTVTIGENKTLTVGKDRTDDIGKNHTETIGENFSSSIGKNHTESIGESSSISVGKDQAVDIAGNSSLAVGKNLSEDIGKNFKLTAGDSITLEVGSSQLVMKKDGTITLKGVNISIAGAKISAKADARIELSGALADVKADGVLTIKGSLTKIN